MAVLHHRCRSKAALLAAGCLLAADARAQEQTETPGEWRLYEENDFFNPFTDQTDRFYTQGIRLERLSPPVERGAEFLPGVTHADWCDVLCGGGAEEGSVNVGYAVGQNIYTPGEIRIAAPQPYDRPWAGMLYLSRIARVSYLEPSLDAQRQDRVEVSVGVVGPIALGKEAQTEWHKIIDVGLPRGWHNQLRNEPILQLRYETALRWPEENGVHADVIPRVRANLGNALTSLEAEVTARIGWNLSGFGRQSLIPFAPPPAAAPMSGPVNALAGRSQWLASGGLFVRAGVEASAHNITLDGNTFARNDIRIDRDPLVPEFAVGAEVNLVGPVWLALQFVRRGSEFTSWRGRKAEAQEFGAISLALTFGD